jgi:hypothetical protein
MFLGLACDVLGLRGAQFVPRGLYVLQSTDFYTKERGITQEQRGIKKESQRACIRK